MLSKDEILAMTKLKTTVVNVPEWGGEVIVSEMSGADRDAWEGALRDRDKKGHLISPRAKLVLFCVVDEKGARIFSDSDLDALGRLSASALDAVCDAAMELNALRSDDLKESEKNS